MYFFNSYNCNLEIHINKSFKHQYTKTALIQCKNEDKTKMRHFGQNVVLKRFGLTTNRIWLLDLVWIDVPILNGIPNINKISN